MPRQGLGRIQPTSIVANLVQDGPIAAPHQSRRTEALEQDVGTWFERLDAPGWTGLSGQSRKLAQCTRFLRHTAHRGAPDIQTNTGDVRLGAMVDDYRQSFIALKKRRKCRQMTWRDKRVEAQLVCLHGCKRRGELPAQHPL